MPQVSSDLIFLTSWLTSFIVWVVLRKRVAIRALVVVALIALGWPLLVRATAHESAQHNREVDLRLARGEEITEEESLADGTGDNVGAQLFGWFPVAAGVVLALPVNFFIRRRTAGHNQRLVRTGPAERSS